MPCAVFRCFLHAFFYDDIDNFQINLNPNSIYNSFKKIQNHPVPQVLTCCNAYTICLKVIVDSYKKNKDGANQINPLDSATCSLLLVQCAYNISRLFRTDLIVYNYWYMQLNYIIIWKEKLHAIKTLLLVYYAKNKQFDYFMI